MLLLAATLAAPSAITVDVDATFIVQVVLFVVLTLVLKPVLFDPLLKLFAEREKRIDGTKRKAAGIDKKSVTALARYEAEMTRARTEGNAEREKLRAEATKREQEILTAMRASTAQFLEDGKRAAQGEAQRARASLQGEGETRARELASRVLGREVQP